MNKVRIYNSSEIKILMNNPNVEMIRNKSQIVYKNSFKLWAVKQKIYHPEKTSRQIFEEAGFDMKIIDDRTPQKRLCSWTKKFKMFGEEYFDDNKKYTYQALENKANNKKYLLIELSDRNIKIYSFNN